MAGRISPALATRRESSKAIYMRSEWLCGSIYSVDWGLAAGAVLYWKRTFGAELSGL